MDQTKARKILSWLPAIAWASMIFYLSTQAFPHKPSWWFENADKVIHVILFGTLSTLVCFALFFGHRMSFFRAALIAIAFSSLYGASDEIHQLFTPTRTCDPFDWMSDTIGACGVFVFSLLPKKRPPPAIVPYGLRKM